MADFETTTTLRAAGIGDDHPLAEILSRRADILRMTSQAQDAALAPRGSGGLPRGLRAALAVRIARLNGDSALAIEFAENLATGGTSDDERQAADPETCGGNDRRLAAILRHTDRVTLDTKSVTAADITALKEAGVSEDDIVRLSELIAFVNYQLRVVAGLRLMGELP